MGCLHFADCSTDWYSTVCSETIGSRAIYGSFSECLWVDRRKKINQTIFYKFFINNTPPPPPPKKNPYITYFRILHNSSMPISHVVIIHQPIMIWHKKFKFHCTICEVERLFSVLIHKSVKNYTGPTSLFFGVIWICDLSHFIHQITSLGKCMLNDYKSTAQNPAAPKVAIMVISSYSIHLYLCVIYTVYYLMKLS